MMDIPYTSQELFHFVGHSDPEADQANYETLTKVLTVGCVSHKPHEKNWGQVGYAINWEMSLENEELIVPTVTCYADIPRQALGIHVSKYGKFGLSFPRDLLIQYGVRPVTYLPTRNDDWRSPHGITLLRDVEAVYKAFNEHVVFKMSLPDSTTRYLGSKPGNETEAADAMLSVFAKDFLAFLKPFSSGLREDHPKNFYMEREWRKHGNLKFDPPDVVGIVVALGYSARLEKEFPAYVGRVVEI
jgi:hypothetical protein